MTYVLVDIHHRTHTCPANSEPHPFDTHRTIVATIDGGPCRNPVTIRCGTTTTTIACGRHEPTTRQCPACRITVTERTITTEHHGPQHTPHRVAA